jgi:phenylalanyl-tRNA synthetase beta chain
MYLSLNWLKDFVKIPASLTPEELGLRLTMHTVEVDEITKQADKFKGVVVGKVLSLKAHPNAERLQIVTVATGKAETMIVCGATNLAVGQLVPVALPGAVLPNGLDIKETEIRGEKSGGMLCAEDELGLGDDHAGILVLEKNAKIGQNMAQYLGLKDVVFTVDNKSINHRPDLWSHFGMAREIAAFLDAEFIPLLPDPGALEPGNENIPFKIKVEDFSLCPRYMAAMVSGIKIEPSPKWLQDRLIAGGARPINNIVDVTNYVLLEIGQPLHAFDRSLLDEIVVRRAQAGETITTLDGSERLLQAGMLVIADSAKPIAIAGVMGGLNSEISDATATIVIEAANFDFVSIRRTSQQLGLRTEASIRYEKALDPNLCVLGLNRAVALIKKICPGAKVAGPVKDEKKFALNQGPIELDLDWLNRRIGADIPGKKALGILNNLGFTVEQKETAVTVTVPTWRSTRDISRPEDLVEEVARIYGYNNLKPRMPLAEMNIPAANIEMSFERLVKSVLAGAPGLNETENYPFVGEDLCAKLGLDTSAYWRLANPLSAHQSLLRQSLVPNLLMNVRTNQARYDHFGLFEIGRIFLSSQSEILKMAGSEEKLPYQEKRLGLVMAGDRRGKTFARAKAVVSHLLAALRLIPPVGEDAYAVLAAELKPAWADAGCTAVVTIAGETAGLVARVDAWAGKKLGLKKEVTVAEIDLCALYRLKEKAGEKRCKEFPKFPPVVRDLAFVVRERIRAADVAREIAGFSGLIAQAELFDSFSGGKLGSDERSLAFHIVYQADRTLKAEEVDKLQKELVQRLEEKFEAKIRDF